MAYDQQAAYHAPPRNYYPPQQQSHYPRQQQPPLQSSQGYDNYGYEYDHRQDYGHHGDRGYDAGMSWKDQGYDYGHDDHGRDMGYQNGPGRPRQGPPPRGPPPRGPPARGPPPRGPPQQRGPPPRGYSDRPPPPDGRGFDQNYDRAPRGPPQMYQQPQYAQSSPQQAHYGPTSPVEGPRSFDMPRPQDQSRSARSRPPPLDRAASAEAYPTSHRVPQRRPLIQPPSPDSVPLPQDNAFPVFPTSNSKSSLDNSPGKNSGREAKDRSPELGSGQQPDHGLASPRMNGHGGLPHSNDSERQYQHEPGHQHAPGNAVRSPPAQQSTFGNMSLPHRPGPASQRGPNNGQPLHVKTSSQSEIYADYYSSDLGVPVSAVSDRDAQIEAEMPNFDNMRSGAHGKDKTLDQHLTSPRTQQVIAPMPPQNMHPPPDAAYASPHMRPAPATRQGSGHSYGPHPANQPPPAAHYQDAYAPRDPYNNARQRVASPVGPHGQRPVLQTQGSTDQYGRPSFDSPQLPPQRPATADQYGRPTYARMHSGGSGYGNQGRAPSAPPQSGVPNGGYGTPLSKQSSQNSNPDSLPHHPVPVRPGLMMDRPSSTQSQQSHQSQNARRGLPGPPATASPVDSRRSSVQAPVTHAEINHLQSLVNAHPQDAATALLLAQKLAEASTVLASENGRLDPRQTAKNREKYIFDAHRRVKKLVSSGYADAMFYLADCYGQGLLGLEEDSKEAFNLYQMAAKAGHAQAAYRTAVCCEMGPEDGGGTRRDVVKAVQWYRRAAQLHDVSAMYKVGVICLKGLLNQPKNIPEAERWLKRAAEKADKENPHAIHELALLYEPDHQDREVRAKIIPDEAYSRELFFRAANMGFKASQFRLGQAYEYGALGLPVDARNSIAWYSKGAAQGDHGAELALSGWYLTGAEGILENSDTEAYLWARKAASADPPLAKAMFAMGYYTETGIGCPANFEEAKRWYGRAASYKFPKAIDRLEEIKRNGGKMPKEQKGTRLQRKDVKEKVR